MQASDLPPLPPLPACFERHNTGIFTPLLANRLQYNASPIGPSGNLNKFAPNEAEPLIATIHHYISELLPAAKSSAQLIPFMKRHSARKLLQAACGSVSTAHDAHFVNQTAATIVVSNYLMVLKATGNLAMARSCPKFHADASRLTGAQEISTTRISAPTHPTFFDMRLAKKELMMISTRALRSLQLVYTLRTPPLATSSLYPPSYLIQATDANMPAAYITLAEELTLCLAGSPVHLVEDCTTLLAIPSTNPENPTQLPSTKP
jgi:hypothetical protein